MNTHEALVALISFWMLRINCGEPFGAEAAGVCMCVRELKKQITKEYLLTKNMHCIMKQVATFLAGIQKFSFTYPLYVPVYTLD